MGLFWEKKELFLDEDNYGELDRKELYFSILEFINSKCTVKLSEITNFLNKKYNPKILNMPVIREECKYWFSDDKGNYYLNEFFERLFFASCVIKGRLENYDFHKYNRKETIENFFEESKQVCEVSDEETKFVKKYTYYIWRGKQKEKMTDYFFAEMLYCENLITQIEAYMLPFTLIKNMNKTKRLDEARAKIPEKYNDYLVEDIFSNEVYVDLMRYLNVFTIGEWKKTDDKNFNQINNYFVDFIISDVFGISDLFEKEFIGNINSALGDLKDSYKEVIFLRHGVDNDCEEMTYRDAGKIAGITHERVRQIDSKCINILGNYSSELGKLFESLLNKNEYEKEYISYEKVSDFLNDKTASAKLSVVFSSENSNVVFNSKYKLFYYRNHTTIEEIIENVINEYSKKIVIKKGDISNLDYYEKKIILDNFKLVNDSVYMKKGVSKTDVIMKVIEEEFPSGFRISGNDFEYLSKRVKEIMCDDTIEINSHAVSALLTREGKGFSIIDRGTYKPKKFCVNLSDDLVSKISDYLLENIPIATYEGILHKFKNELETIDVKSKYYLKGILDDRLDKDIFTPQKDSIIIGGSGISVRKRINQLVEESDVPMTLKDIMKKIPGVRDYTVLQTLDVNDDVLMVDTNTFLSASKIKYTDEDVKFLKDQIEKVFELLKTDVIITRKVYARIKMFNSEFFQKFTQIDNFIGFYSFLQYLFSKEYFMRRPYISKNGDMNLTKTGLLTEYAKTLDSFDYNDLNDYVLKMNMSGNIFSYLEFMEDLSSLGYVQINKGTMLKKQLLEQKVSMESINKIDNIMSLILERRESLNTQLFNGYHIFPDVGYKWSKYLLVGILRTYFNDKYNIDYTANFYDTTDFVISLNK